MKIGVDLSFIKSDHTNGGTEACIINLMKGFEEIGKLDEFTFFIHEDIYIEYKRNFPNANFQTYKLGGSHKIRTMIFQTLCLKKFVQKHALDCIYFPTYTTGLRLNYGVPVIVNPHDIQFKYYPEYFSKLKRVYLDFLYRHSLSKADLIVGISNYTKTTLEECYKKNVGNKIKVLYDAIDFENNDIEPLVGIEGNYILSVNSIQKHKNIITLIKAFNDIKEDFDGKLVLVGNIVNGETEIANYMKENNLYEHIVFTGRISDGVIKWLYLNANLFVTPSLYEGFGMTPVEAMARGCKVISTRCTSLEEATMGLATYYEDPLDEIELAEVILKSLADNEKYEYKELLMYDKKNIAQMYYNEFKRIV